MHFSKKDLFTIPNIMTYFRILLVPVFVVFYLGAYRAGNSAGYFWALGCVVVSGLTDVFDGIVARALNQITDIGKILDPIADKAMQFAMMFCVIVKYKLVIIMLTIYALKEIVSFCFSSYLFTHNKNIGGSKWFGKVCTVILYGVMFIFVLPFDIKTPISTILICVSSAFMLLAFVLYMVAYAKLLAQLRCEMQESGTSNSKN